MEVSYVKTVVIASSQNTVCIKTSWDGGRCPL